MKENFKLLTSLFKLSRRSEDFVTDSFVHLLKTLAMEEPKFLNQLLRMISGNKGIFNVKPEHIHVRNFEETERGKGYPDIQIIDDNNVLIIEAKLGAPISKFQLEHYKEILNRSSKTKKRSLAMIIGLKDEKDLIRGVKLNRWYEIALEFNNRKFRGSQVMNYLIEEFLDLLRFNQVYSYPARGELSIEFRDLMEKVSRNSSIRKNTIIFQRQGSTILHYEKDKFKHLPKLYSFLVILETSIKEVFDPRNIKFLLFQRRLIGFTIENLKYCFWIEYSDPDVWGLEYHNGEKGIPQRTVENLKINQDEMVELAWGKYRFYKLINLNQAKFFKLNEIKRKYFLKRQLRKFQKFCQKNFI